jgi:hypothetical protein
MTKGMLLGALIGLIALNPACGSGAQEEQTTPVCVGPPTDPRCVLTVDGQAFVRAAGPVTDGVSTATVRHSGESICMSGKLDPGPANANWGAFLALALEKSNFNAIPAPFDATARGIKQVRLTIENPPVTGFTIELSAVQRADCLEIPACLTTAPFQLEDGSGQAMVIENPGTITAPLASFVQPSWGDPSLSFDPSLISALHLDPIPLPGVVLDYDFCVRALTFLDASGREVSP